jgi:uncharacterized protein YrrD
MKVDLDAKVRTRDGKHAGTVQRVILEPISNEISGFVVSTGTLFGRDVVVSREALESGTREGNIIQLDLTKDELKKLPDFNPAEYAAPPAGWVPPAGFGYPATGVAWPVGYPYEAGRVDAPSGTKERTLSIGKGAPVFARDGDDVGVVDEVLFEQDSGSLRGFVLRVGGALETMLGGGRTLEIESGLVGRVTGGIVYLEVDKNELRRRVEAMSGRAR